MPGGKDQGGKVGDQRVLGTEKGIEDQTGGHRQAHGEDRPP